MKKGIPFSRKFLVQGLTGLVAFGLQAVIPGYNPDPYIQGLIALGIGDAAGFLVKEEEKYLKVALTARQRGE